MSSPSSSNHSYQVELDDSLYSLDPLEQEFLSSQTGIGDQEELKRHVLRLQKEAYSVSDPRTDFEDCCLVSQTTSISRSIPTHVFARSAS